ncbi:hypothetical protein C8Q74DRAFT_1295881 [Fomes fomentarius]|nr:hypothetical protein C8Q74DRAFT_1295881 [Fomes fomentarius]
MRHRGYEVWLTSNGVPLAEYQSKVEGEDWKTMACIVPSESGKNFAVHWHDGVGEHHLSLSFTLDGSKLGHGSTCFPGGTGLRSGVSTSTDTEQPFQFSDLQFTDDDTLLSDISSQADLGTIKVTITRVQSEYWVVPYHPGGFQPVGAVHERSKKAGAHSVSLGKGTRVSGKPLEHLVRRNPINRFEGFIAVFIFRYRPRALLQAQGIMPASAPAPSNTNRNGGKRARSPTDVKPAKLPKVEPTAAKVDLSVIVISDDDEDADVLQSRLRQVQRDRAKKKQRRVKEGPGASGSSLGDVIDLTLDD